MKDVQCFELFGGMAHKSIFFFFFNADNSWKERLWPLESCNPQSRFVVIAASNILVCFLLEYVCKILRTNTMETVEVIQKTRADLCTLSSIYEW